MSNIHPVLRYQDAPKAIDWLERAFGFERLVVIPGEGGAILHAELRFGTDVVMLGSGTSADALSVVIDDLDAHYRRAVDAGADIMRPLQDTPYGTRAYSARDLEGRVWTFGTYRPQL
jgi:uncharacterized glyoxalase superfamily protein PhnB